MSVPKNILNFGGTNNIFADCSIPSWRIRTNDLSNDDYVTAEDQHNNILYFQNMRRHRFSKIIVMVIYSTQNIT